MPTKIEIDASQVTEVLLSGYPVSLRFNHQALVEQGAAPDGSDLVIASTRNNTVKSLPRSLDMQSAWNLDDTKIWFAIDERIEAGSSVTGVYSIVTQNPTLSPNDDRSRIFQDFEDFGDRILSPARWSEQMSTQGTRSLSITRDAVILSASPEVGVTRTHMTLRQRAASYWPTIRVDAMIRYTNTGLSGGCGRVFPIAFTSEGDNEIRAGFLSNISDYGAVSHNDTLGIDQTTLFPNLSPEKNTWQLHSLSWVHSRISYWLEDQALANTQSKGSITRANQKKLQLEFSAGARQIGCSGQGELGLEVDWYRVRRFTFPEPAARVVP